MSQQRPVNRLYLYSSFWELWCSLCEQFGSSRYLAQGHFDMQGSAHNLIVISYLISGKEGGLPQCKIIGHVFVSCYRYVYLYIMKLVTCTCYNIFCLD